MDAIAPINFGKMVVAPIDLEKNLSFRHYFSLVEAKKTCTHRLKFLREALANFVVCLSFVVESSRIILPKNCIKVNHS